MRPVTVYAGWREVGEPRVMGRLTVSSTRGQEVLSFECDDAWLLDRHAHELDPGLRMFSGSQYPRPDKPNFGLLLDSSPDRWGRLLQDRREAQIARSEGREARKLQPTDYLLGVHDLQRLGGLRFKVDLAGPFLDDNKKTAVPLSPAYDMNPVPGSDALSIRISDADNSLNLDLALEVSVFFRLSANAADQILDQVLRSVRTWKTVARTAGLSNREQEEMADAFRLAESKPY